MNQTLIQSSLAVQNHYDSLQKLLEEMPVHNSRHNSKLPSIFSSYKSIIAALINTNEYYCMNLNLFSTEFGDIECDVRQSQTASSQKKKDAAFSSAVLKLKDDIEAAMQVIKSNEK